MNAREQTVVRRIGSVLDSLYPFRDHCRGGEDAFFQALDAASKLLADEEEEE